MSSKQRPALAKQARASRPKVARAPDFVGTVLARTSRKAGNADVRSVDATEGLVSIDDAIMAGNQWELIHRLKGLERIAMIQDGVQAATFRGLASQVDRPVSDLSKSLGLAPSTMRRKAKDGEKLSTADSERVVGFVSLIGQVHEMVGEDRPADFDAAKWLTQWVQEPHPALGGRKPDEMLDTTTGQALVSDLLASMASGSYW